MWIAIFIIMLTLLFWFLGYEGMVRLDKQRPKIIPKNLPPVSIIIPSYNSEKTIGETLKSIKAMDYPRKEIIVINDSDDKTPQIVKKYGVKLIQNKKRMGKSVSLDMATKKAKNEILLFVDSDTIVEKNLLKKLVPWFYKPKIAAMMPTFISRGNNGISKMIAIENIFMHSHLRTQNYFGSLISFRGCCFAMRKSVIKKMGGWGKALTEDNDMGARVAKSGYHIFWEPRAAVRTSEPETKEELKKQKVRWGAGSAYSFFRHRKYYMKSPQFLLYFFPYIILSMLIGLLGLWSFYLLVTTVSLMPLVILATELLLIIVATYFHITVQVYSERGFINPILLIKYMVYYIPLVTLFYSRGFLKGIKGKRKKINELDLDLW